ncbi:MAG: hypothetical protein JWN44_6446 [Myxococcales bacterium]|nr:hypothetical protein [Myxococcales bacterium]
MATVPYLPTLGHDFVMDDGVQITKNPAVTQSAPLSAYFLDKATIASRADYRVWYRPIRTVGFRAVAALGGVRPVSYGVTNLALYALCAILVAGMALQVSGGDRAAALAATALWAALPVHVEPVSYYSALGDVLSLALELGALSCAARAIGRPSRAALFGVASLALALLAMGAKEMALTEGGILFVGIASAWSRLDPAARRRAILTLAGHALVTVAYFALHHHIIGAVGQGAISAHTIGSGLLRAPVYLWAYVATIVAPTGHAAAYADLSSPAWKLAVSWLGVVAVAVATWRARQPTLRFALGWFVVALIPVLHLVPLHSYYADRFALVPSVGLALALAVGLAALRGRTRACALALAVPLCAGYLIATAVQARAWRDDRTLWQAAVDAQPRAALAHANLGLALLRDRRPADALPHFEIARAIDGDKPEVRLGIATAYDQLGRAADAEAAARAALASDDSDARLHALLGGILAKRGDLEGAAGEAERARTLNPDLASAWTLSAHLAEVRGARADALAAWRRAAALNPNAADLHAEIARLSLASGDRAGAAVAARSCLRLRPGDARCQALLARTGSQ